MIVKNQMKILYTYILPVIRQHDKSFPSICLYFACQIHDFLSLSPQGHSQLLPRGHMGFFHFASLQYNSHNFFVFPFTHLYESLFFAGGVVLFDKTIMGYILNFYFIYFVTTYCLYSGDYNLYRDTNMDIFFC